MPMYEYRCKECGTVQELLRRFAEADTGVDCPKCSSQKVDRIFSTFATGGCGAGPSGRFG